MNIIDSFKDHCANVGVVIDEPIIADGNLHRAHVKSDPQGTKNAAYILYPNGAGFIQCWKRGVKIPMKSSDGKSLLTREIRQQLEAEKLKRRQEQEQGWEQAAITAVTIWRNAKPAPENHAYLLAKKIKPHPLRMKDYSLIVPIRNAKGLLVNLQFIDQDGTKRFLKGGRKKGMFSVIGDQALQSKRLLICEGWATGASLHEATGLTVIVALDAGNLLTVARTIRMLAPNAEIVVCGDNDLSGVGQEAAEKAALAVGGRCEIPATTGHDWNDAINAGVDLCQI